MPQARAHQVVRGGHLDGNGYRWFGEMLGKVYYQSQVQGKPFRPLQPTAIARETLPTQIRIKYHVPVRPLVFDTYLIPKIKDYGFEVYLRDYRQENKQIIKQVEIDGDDVVLTCEQPLVGDVIVVYAGTRSFILSSYDTDSAEDTDRDRRHFICVADHITAGRIVRCIEHSGQT